MITCSNCNTKFNIDLYQIKPHSKIHCPNCHQECVVKLFDLDNVNHNTHDGFSTIINDVQHDIKETLDLKPTKDSPYIGDNHHKHFISIIGALSILLIGFIIGIEKINYLEAHYPSISRLYQYINILPKQSIIIAHMNIELLDNQHNLIGMIVHIDVSNHSKKSEVISDIVIKLYDKYHNTIGSSDLTPYLILKSADSANFKIKIPSVKHDLKYISVFINGKSKINQFDIINSVHHK